MFGYFNEIVKSKIKNGKKKLGWLKTSPKVGRVMLQVPLVFILSPSKNMWLLKSPLDL
jgi:hypothetical protein